MPSILIGEEGLRWSYFITHFIYHVKCGVLLEVSIGSHASLSARSCHAVVPIPHPHLHIRYEEIALWATAPVKPLQMTSRLHLIWNRMFEALPAGRPLNSAGEQELSNNLCRSKMA